MNQSNKVEKVRIDELLSSGRISAEDHRVLMAALENRKSGFQMALSWIFSPFENLSTHQALLVGAVAVLLLSIFGELAQIYFPGALDVQVAQEGKRVYSFLDLLIQNLIAVFSLSVVFCAIALVFKQKNLRFIDFLSYISFSRYPYALFVILMFILGTINPAFLPRTSEIKGVFEILVLACLSIPMLIWQMVILFKAMKSASGFKGKILWFSFIFGVVIAEIASVGLNILIFK